MSRQAVILDGAQKDFRAIKKFIKQHFGNLVWNEVNQEFKNTIQHITSNPLFGTCIDELEGLGYNHFRKTHVRQTRVIYEFDDQYVIVHMFIHTRMEFKTHLERRLLTPN